MICLQYYRMYFIFLAIPDASLDPTASAGPANLPPVPAVRAQVPKSPTGRPACRDHAVSAALSRQLHEVLRIRQQEGIITNTLARPYKQ